MTKPALQFSRSCSTDSAISNLQSSTKNNIQSFFLSRKEEVIQHYHLDTVKIYPIYIQKVEALYNQLQLHEVPEKMEELSRLLQALNVIENWEKKEILKNPGNKKKIAIACTELAHCISHKNTKILILDNLQLTSLPDLSEFEVLDHVKKISLNGNLLTDMGLGNFFKRRLPALKKLDIRNNLLTTVTWLKTQPTLKELYISYNKISSLNGMPELPLLKSLLITSNRLASLSGMPFFPFLELLFLTYNNLSSLESLPVFPSLKFLRVIQNNIGTLAGMPSLPALEHLSLDRNQINSINEMPHLPALINMEVRQNPVSASLNHGLLALPASNGLCHFSSGVIRVFHYVDNIVEAEFKQAYPAEFIINHFYKTAKINNKNEISIPEKHKEKWLNFLNRLILAADYEKNRHPSVRKVFAKRVISLVKTFSKQPGLFDIYSEKITDASAHCQDASVMTMSDIELDLKIRKKMAHPDQNTKWKEIIKIFSGKMRLRMVEHHAIQLAKKNNSEKESIETAFSLKLQLKDSLNLPVKDYGMKYPAMGVINQDKINETRDIVKKEAASTENLLSFLEAEPLWEDFVKNNPLPEEIQRTRTIFLIEVRYQMNRHNITKTMTLLDECHTELENIQEMDREARDFEEQEAFENMKKTLDEKLKYHRFGNLENFADKYAVLCGEYTRMYHQNERDYLKEKTRAVVTTLVS